MRKKLISHTYLRDVSKYILKIDYSNDDYWYAVKKIIATEPFILSNGLKVIANGYYILELIPKNENYAMRVFFNDQKEILEYYFDLSLENGLDLETKIPYYDDAYIDITLTNDQIEILDQDELDEALKKKVISKKDYDFINQETEKLYLKIKNKTNKYLNLDLRNLL